MPASLAEKINGCTIDLGLNWAVIKLAKNRTLSDRTPQRSSGVKVPTGVQVSDIRGAERLGVKILGIMGWISWRLMPKKPTRSYFGLTQTRDVHDENTSMIEQDNN
jgi:hypothetical protein